MRFVPFVFRSPGLCQCANVCSMALVASLVAACHDGPRSVDDVGSSDRELIDVVSFETGCPEAQIDIVDRPSRGGGEYDVVACGEKLTYTRTDEVFHTADAGS